MLQDANSEENFSDRESASENSPFYLRKETSTKWSKELPRQSFYIRRFNILT